MSTFTLVYMKINLVIITFFGCHLPCGKSLLWGTLLWQFLPPLILISLSFLSILHSKYFSILNIFKTAIWGRELTLCNIFSPSVMALNVYHTLFTTMKLSICHNLYWICLCIATYICFKNSPTYTLLGTSLVCIPAQILIMSPICKHYPFWFRNRVGRILMYLKIALNL